MAVNEIEAISPDKSMCKKCGRLLKNDSFYLRRGGQSHIELCKACLTMHIDNFAPETYVWILKDLDFPYIESEWNILRDKAYARAPSKMNGMSVIGRYIAKMKLKQWSQYSWADTERLQQEAEAREQEKKEERKKYEEQIKTDFEEGKISEAQYKTIMSTSKQWEEHVEQSQIDAVAGPNNNNMFDENNFISEDALPDPTNQLTQEDKIYLAMKWGRLYRPDEWLEMEKTYTDYSKAADMDDPDTAKTLILLSKTYLKMNQSIDNGDVDGYQKLAKVYDAQRKSLNLTAVQNKEDKGDFVDCVGVLVRYCEEHGGAIPRYNLRVNYDILDAEIKDMKRYNKDLIYQDTALARQIEDYIKQRQIAEEMKADRKRAKDTDTEITMTDKNISDFHEHLNKQADADAAIEMSGE